MADFGINHATPKVESWGVNSSGASGGTTVSATTAGVYGSWVQLTAASGVAATHLIIVIADPNGGNEIDVDIGIGAAGSEVVVAQSLFLRADGYVRNNGMTYSVPIQIPINSRVSARMLGSAASRSCQVSVRAIAGPSAHASFSKMENLGGTYFNTAGYTANVKGAWNVLSASVPNDVKALHLTWGLIDFVSGQTSAALIDFGIGASGSETILVPDLHVTAHDLSGASHNTFQNAFFPSGLPAGTRLAFRAQVSAGSSSRYLFMAAHGYR